MKKTYCILTVISLAICATGCVIILEETGFDNNKSVYYSLSLDASHLMEMFSDLNDLANQKKTDTVISFASIYEDEIDRISSLSPEEQKALETFKQFNLKMNFDGTENLFKIQIFGDFADFNSFQNAMTNLDKVQKHLPKVPLETDKIDASMFEGLPFFGLKSKTEFKGNTFSKTVFPSAAAALIEKEYENQPDSLDFYLNAMKEYNEMNELMQGTFTSTYTFAKKIKNVHNSAASVSVDGKTATLTFDLQEYIKNPEKSSVVIELED